MMFRSKKKETPRLSDVERRQEARIISGLVASRHLSESHNGKYARALIWTVVMGIGLFIYWAAVTPVYEIVSGSGTIRPEGLSTRIEHREGGLVVDLVVSEGDSIRAGDIIARIDETQMRAEMQKLEAKQNGLAQDIARYRWLLSLDLADAENRDLISDLPGADASAIEEVNYRIAQIDTMYSQREVARAQRQALQGQMTSLASELTILRGQLARFETLGDNIISLSRTEDLSREILRLESSLAQLDGEFAVQSAMILQLRSSENELVGQYRREAALQLDERLEERIAVNQSSIQIEDRLKRSVVRSPVSGIVNALSIQNIGEVITPGEVIAEIIPENTRAFAEIEVPADRIGGVQVGRHASMKVLTYDFTRFGDIPAIVERISPSSFTKANGEIVFRVQLSFAEDRLNLESSLNARPILMGMTVVADIKSEQRTILSYLLKPMRVIADRAFTEA
jgi:adhesin transport system membrane fusion protein